MYPFSRHILTELQLEWRCALPLLCRPTPWVQQKSRQWLGWLPQRCHTKTALGFTLAELLIALAILGVIATFTIPKIIAAQTNGQYNAEAKEVAGMLSDALTKYKYDTGITAGVSKDTELFQYMNYVKWDTSSSIDFYPLFSGPLVCSNASPCIKLHNGGILAGGGTWYGTNTTDGLGFVFDPDGVYTGRNDSVDLVIYTDGVVRSRETLKANTEFSGGAIRGPQAGADPTWFKWQ